MDILTQLEQRIDSLLETVSTLTAEKARLQEELESGLAAFAEENSQLKAQVDEERATRQAVLDRVDAMLAKVQSHTGEA